MVSWWWLIAVAAAGWCLGLLTGAVMAAAAVEDNALQRLREQERSREGS